MVLGARIEQLVVGPGLDAAGYCREETRPAGAAFVFHLGGEKRQVASRAGEVALALLVVERARARTLGRLLAQDRELLRREPLLPFVLRKLELLDLDGVLGLRGEGETNGREDRGQQRDEVSSFHVR